MINKQMLKKFNSTKPLLFGGFIQKNNGVIIISGYKKIVFKKISDKERKLLVDALSLCDGINTVNNIISKLRFLKYDTKEATNLGDFPQRLFRLWQDNNLHNEEFVWTTSSFIFPILSQLFQSPYPWKNRRASPQKRQ